MKLNKSRINDRLDEKMELMSEVIGCLFDIPQEAEVVINDLEAEFDDETGELDLSIKTQIDLCDDDEDDDDDELVDCDEDCDNCTYYDGDDDDDYDGPCLGIPPIEGIIFNPPATVVLWADGTKTVVKCMEGQPFERYAGFSAAVMKKLFGSSSHAKKVMNICNRDNNKPEPEPEPKYESITKSSLELSLKDDKEGIEDFKKQISEDVVKCVTDLVLSILGFHKPTGEKE